MSTTTAIPQELRDRDQWLTWYYDAEGVKKPNGKSNDSSTWTSFQAVEIFDLIGFVFSADDQYCGIDLDGCLIDGQLTDWAEEILYHFRGLAYAEISPSGNGIKLWTRAVKPQGSTCKVSMGPGKQQIECYDRGRYFTVTGQLIAMEGFDSIGDGQEAVNWLSDKYLRKVQPQPQTPPPQPQQERQGQPGDLLRRATAYTAKVPPVSEGGRNQAAFSLAGHLHSMVGHSGERLTDAEMLDLMRQWNSQNLPPLDDHELQAAMNSGRKNGTPPPDKPPGSQQSYTSTEGAEQVQVSLFEPVAIGDLISGFPELRQPIVSGLLRRGETANIIAAAKVGKSFLAGNLAWCVATGTPWLGHEVAEGKVLILDNELHPETLAHRLGRIAWEMKIHWEHYHNMIEVVSLRGENLNIHALESRLKRIDPGKYQLVILDALYRTLPEGTSENDNAAMMAIFNRLDYYAKKWDCGVVVVHHASKGQQGDKAVTDVGAGAGSISRAADTHLVVRPHEDEELSVLEAVTRSFKSPEPRSVRFDWPLWSVVRDEPLVKRLGQRREEKQRKDDEEADGILAQAMAKHSDRWLSASQIERATGMGPSRVKRAIGRAIHMGTFAEKVVKRGGRRVDVFRVNATASATAQNM